MESNIKAVFYKYRYYILPPEYDDIKKIEDGTKINARRLKEERCMAPNFIYESMADETLVVEDATLLFEVSVNLYSGKEYDAILSKQIKKVCPGCSNYVDNDDESLDGHHREISLDGVCYERFTKGETPSYALRIHWFWCEIREKLNDITLCIDKGDMKKLDKICKSCGYVEMPVRFFGDKRNGKYRLFWQSFSRGDLSHNLFWCHAQSTSIESSPVYDCGLEVIPYIPKDADLDLHKFKESSAVFAVTESVTHGTINILIEFKKRLSDKKADEYLDALHLYLCKNFGEEVLIDIVEEYKLSNVPEKDALTLNGLTERITAFVKDKPESEFPAVRSVGWENEENALFGRNNYDGKTKCYSFTAIGADKDYAKEFNFGDIAYASLHIPVAVGDEDRIFDITFKYLMDSDIPEPVILKENSLGRFALTGVGFNSGGEKGDSVILEFLVIDEKAFYRYIQILAPVFGAFNAKLIVVNDDGANEYTCGYKIEPANCLPAS